VAVLDSPVNSYSAVEELEKKATEMIEAMSEIQRRQCVLSLLGLPFCRPEGWRTVHATSFLDRPS
jgi:hypothetical protein